MLQQFHVLLGHIFRRKIFMMYGIAISLGLFLYILCLFVPFDVSSGHKLQQGEDYVTEFDSYKYHNNRSYYDVTLTKDKPATSKSLKYQNKTKRLPQAIIIGVKKAGTRALLEYLRLHPDVKAPGPEPHFFDKHYNKGLKWYRNLMPLTVKGQLTVEKTPSYFITKGVSEKIYKMSKKTKLIVAFRDPVTRAISDYTQLVSINPNVKSFHEMVYWNNRTKIINTSWTIVKIGIYAQHLARWLEYFPIGQIHFVSAENLIKSPAEEMKKVQKFLGLKQYITKDHFIFNQTKGFPCYLKTSNAKRKWHCLNGEKGRHHPGVDNSVINILGDFYRPFNRKLYSMTGIDFGWS